MKDLRRRELIGSMVTIESPRPWDFLVRFEGFPRVSLKPESRTIPRLQQLGPGAITINGLSDEA
jgi:hypothetical protein